MGAREMTLRQFLDYMGDDEVFQVSLDGDDWGDYTEFNKHNRLLQPYMECRVDCMGAAMRIDNSNIKEAVIRIGLDIDSVLNKSGGSK